MGHYTVLSELDFQELFVEKPNEGFYLSNQNVQEKHFVTFVKILANQGFSGTCF